MKMWASSITCYLETHLTPDKRTLCKIHMDKIQSKIHSNQLMNNQCLTDNLARENHDKKGKKRANLRNDSQKNQVVFTAPQDLILIAANTVWTKVSIFCMTQPNW